MLGRVHALAFPQLNEHFKHPLHRKHLSSSVGAWKHKTVRLDADPSSNRWQKSHGQELETN